MWKLTAHNNGAYKSSNSQLVRAFTVFFSFSFNFNGISIIKSSIGNEPYQCKKLIIYFRVCQCISFSSSASLLHITHTYYVFVMLHIFGRYFFPFHFISHVFIVCCTHIMRKEMKFLINNASSQRQLTYKVFDECLGPGNMYTLHCYLYK